MGKILSITQLGHPVLRETAAEVSDPLEADVQELLDDLIATVADANGVGIAAPQVYEPLRAFILWSRPNPRYPYAPQMDPLAVINPKIIKASSAIEKDWEGCLSIPGVRGFVPRHKSIQVEFTDRTGKIVQAEYSDFVARIFQHEYDHLEGVVFLDRLESTRDIMMEKEWLKVIANRTTTK